MYCVICAVYGMQCLLCSMRCVVCSVRCVPCTVLCAVRQRLTSALSAAQPEGGARAGGQHDAGVLTHECRLQRREPNCSILSVEREWDEICTVDTPIALMSGRPLRVVVVADSSTLKRYLYFVFVTVFDVVLFYVYEKFSLHTKLKY